MANKARYYGIATREEKQDVEDNSRGARIYPETFGYRAVKAAILNYKDKFSNLNDLSSVVAASRLAKMLTETGKYGTITSSRSRIIGENYSISITKHEGVITPSKASERTDEEKK